MTQLNAQGITQKMFLESEFHHLPIFTNARAKVLHAGIQTLHECFIKKRDQIPLLYSDPDLVLSYAYYYMPTNWPKFSYLIDHLCEDLLNDFMTRAFIDFGAGPGTYSFAFKNSFPDFTLPIYQIEHAKEMAKVAKQIFEELQITNALIQNPKKIITNATMLFGHCLNEMNESNFEKIISQYSPYNIIIIDNGTPSVSEKLNIIRPKLFAANYHNHYPCPLSQGLCPVSWCHQIIKVKNPPAYIQAINNKLKLKRNILPVTAHVYSKMPAGKKEIKRIIRWNPPTLELCSNNDIEKIIIKDKKMAKKMQKELPIGEDYKINQ